MKYYRLLETMTYGPDPRGSEDDAYVSLPKNDSSCDFFASRRREYD